MKENALSVIHVISLALSESCCRDNNPYCVRILAIIGVDCMVELKIQLTSS